jgi:hypothetical protein
MIETYKEFLNREYSTSVQKGLFEPLSKRGWGVVSEIITLGGETQLRSREFPGCNIKLNHILNHKSK